MFCFPIITPRWAILQYHIWFKRCPSSSHTWWGSRAHLGALLPQALPPSCTYLGRRTQEKDKGPFLIWQWLNSLCWLSAYQGNTNLVSDPSCRSCPALDSTLSAQVLWRALLGRTVDSTVPDVRNLALGDFLRPLLNLPRTHARPLGGRQGSTHKPSLFLNAHPHHTRVHPRHAEHVAPQPLRSLPGHFLLFSLPQFRLVYTCLLPEVHWRRETPGSPTLGERSPWNPSPQACVARACGLSPPLRREGKPQLLPPWLRQPSDPRPPRSQQPSSTSMDRQLLCRTALTTCWSTPRRESGSITSSFPFRTCNT